MDARINSLEQITGNRHSGAIQLFFAPSMPLCGVISHYTVQLHYACEQPHDRPLTIVPDASGCLIFTVKSGVVEQLFWGPNNKMHQVTRDFSAITMRLLVEFLPGGMFRFFEGLPLHELQNGQDTLESISPTLDRLFLPMVEKHYQSYPALLRAVDAALTRRFGTVIENSLLRQILTHTSAVNGILRLDALADSTSYSARHINRLCQERIGVSYKSFVRILRINEACRRINYAVTDLRTLAHDLDFHDQAHFTKDFKMLCSVTPSDYQRNLSHFYNEEMKLCNNLPCRYGTHTKTTRS